jgi:hypothetical protein
VQYLSAAEREQYRLFVKDGRLYHASDGTPFDTGDAASLHQGQGQAIFVMDEYGNIYASTKHEFASFHHSSFLSGQPVAGAGEIKVKNGSIVEITDRSGHYRPAPPYLDQVLNQLKHDGVDTSTITRGKR